MKRLLNNSLKTRIPQVIMLVALVAAVAAFSRPYKRGGSCKLDGTWVGRSQGGLTWKITYAPNSSGRYATFTEEWMSNGLFDYLALAPVGADKSSLVSGYTRMNGKQTAFSEATWYLTGPADDPTFGLTEIKAIAVLTGNLRFTDLNTMEGTYDLKIYNTLIKPDPSDPETWWRDLSMVPTEAMGDPYLPIDGTVEISRRIF